MPSRRTAIWNPGAPPEHRFYCPERRVVPGVRAMARLNVPQRVGWGQGGRRGQRRTTVRANAGLYAMRLCPPYVAAADLMTAVTATPSFPQAPAPPTAAEILALRRAPCVVFQAAEPTHAACAKAPAGWLLKSI